MKVSPLRIAAYAAGGVPQEPYKPTECSPGIVEFGLQQIGLELGTGAVIGGLIGFAAKKVVKVIFQSQRPHQMRSEPVRAWRLFAPRCGRSILPRSS